MRKDVVSFVHECPVCQKSRVTANDSRIVERHIIEAYEPFQEVSIDSIVNLPVDADGNKVILVIIDNFSRFVELFAVKDVSAKIAAKCLLEVCGRYGSVAVIRSDNGGQFVSEVFKELVSIMGSRQLLTVGYRPSANGVVERVNAEIMKHLSTIVHSKGLRDRWSYGLPLVQRIINSTVHSSTGFAPSQLIFGNALSIDRGLARESPSLKHRDASEHFNELQQFLVDAVAASQSYLATLNDRRVKKVADSSEGQFKMFEVGDLVLARRSGGDKFDFKWRGPFRIVSVGPSNIYECLDFRTGKVVKFDVSILKKFEVSPGVDPTAVAGLDEDEFVVDSILGHVLKGKNKRNKTHYYFNVRFEDGTEDLIPYMEVRELEVFDVYLRNHPDFAKLLRLDVSP